MDELIAALLPAISGIIFTLVLFSPEIGTHRDVKKLINECEQELPRNQHCTIKAIAEKTYE